MHLTLWHNPRCSKSRQALELLRGRGVEPTIVLYLTEPPDRRALEDALRALGVEPRALLRRSEDLYRQLELDDPALTGDQLIDAMVANPILIERPIVIVGDRAVVARPPERVLEILGEDTPGS